VFNQSRVKGCERDIKYASIYFRRRMRIVITLLYALRIPNFIFIGGLNQLNNVTTWPEA
jgi:hypothetical protein